MKAFLGMGLLGSNFVKAMIARGDSVQVWNRSPEKAKAMEKHGAKAFTNVAEAVRGTSHVHLTLKDDASVEEVLNQAAAGLEKETIIIDHTTTTMEGAIRRTKQWKERGLMYQHAPVFMGPPNALDSSGFMLVSGDQSLIALLEPELSRMTGKLLNFGPTAGKAAAMKLIGNSFLVGFTASIADTIALAKALDTPVSDIDTLFSSWNPATTLAARLKRMTSGDYSMPSWELVMARKDTQLFLQAAANSGVSLSVIPAVAAVMDHYIGQGHGHDDWTVIAKDGL